VTNLLLVLLGIEAPPPELSGEFHRLMVTVRWLALEVLILAGVLVWVLFLVRAR